MKKRFNFKAGKQRLTDVTKKLGAEAADQWDNVVGTVSARRVVVGVTGLSRSGKTTFLTSLINQLLEHEKSSLTRFEAHRKRRIQSVKLKPSANSELPLFPYHQAFESIIHPTYEWPESTRGLSGCCLEVTLKNKNNTLLSRETTTLQIELRDYPGEWILDLPLLSQSYLKWCRDCISLYAGKPRRSIMGPLWEDIRSIDPFSPAEPAQLKDIANRYRQFLLDCHHGEHQLSYIQPGRMLVPESVDYAVELEFFPLSLDRHLTDEELADAPDGSYYKILDARYKNYVIKYVKPFFQDFFKKTDRQIVLVDLLRSLNLGQTHFDDMVDSLREIMKSLRFGPTNPFLQLFLPRVDKAILIATKVDQILYGEHENAQRLLGGIESTFEPIDALTRIETVAAVRASNEHKKGDEAVLEGHLDGKKKTYIPTKLPTKYPLTQPFWEAFRQKPLYQLTPPRNVRGGALPHIKMDEVLEFILGDKC